jgi:TRAP-type C4-dicarboxylate transport system permease small subunit
MTKLFSRLSDLLANLERRLLILSVALMMCLILLNVITRTAKASLYWVDEVAVFVMVFVCFIGASLMVRKRLDFAVTLLTDKLPPTIQRWAQWLVALITLGFGVMLLALCWKWFDVSTLASLGFDEKAFFRETFNNIYREKTMTTGTRKAWFFLIMPWFAFTLTIHALANFIEDTAAALGKRPVVGREEAAI